MPSKSSNDQHIWSQIETFPTPTRVVFLGASNLSRSFPTAVNIAREMLNTRLAIHAAMGLGRSYGKQSGFIGKKFSGIFFSRLWDVYEQETSPATLAFVTDIGNDLAYEESVSRIMEWVESCVARLEKNDARVALTNVPIGVLRTLSRARFEFFRAVLFPRCRLDWSTLLGRAEELHERLDAFAQTHKRPIFTVPNAWYGFDPIHPRSSRLADYWRAMFGLLATPSTAQRSRATSLRSYLRVRTLSTPDVRWQPAQRRFSLSRAVLDDGTSIALY